jgi:hydroxymethylpyrimidine pyrophosphatase-like HAD family hydrolase
MDEIPKHQWLLVSDVDDTLAGHASPLAEFAEKAGNITLVLNSSRPRDSVLSTIATFPKSLRIDGCITALGTEILFGGHHLSDWQKTFAHWDRRPVDETLARFPAVPHAPEFQTPYKASYSLPADFWPDVHAALRALPQPCEIITSGTSDLDVIPTTAGKGNATLWLARHLAIPSHRLIVAGDSANDLSMFHVAEKAIAVGNARRELTDHAHPHTTFFATQPRALGLLQGLRHWGALPHT